MLLLVALEKYPAEIFHDFQHYYNLNAEEIGQGITLARAATLLEMLPAGSKYMAAVCPAAEWDEKTYLLASIEHSLRVLAWQNTEDARKKRNKPKPVETPEIRRERVSKIKNTDIENIKKILDLEK